MQQLNILILPGHWELWFLDNERVFSGHEMDWMDLLSFIPRWGTFSWSYIYLDNILSDDHRNVFSLRSSDMPKTFQDVKDALSDEEVQRMMDSLNKNRSQL